MMLIYGNGFSDAEKSAYKLVIHGILVDSLKRILKVLKKDAMMLENQTTQVISIDIGSFRLYY